MRTIGQLTGVPARKGDLYGVELEVEYPRAGVTRGFDVPNWVVTGDNSLRNGAEYVSNPLPLEEIATTLPAVLNYCVSNGGETTKRCGLHGHINFSDKTMLDVQKFSILYALLEPTIYETYCTGRDDSNFAVPLWDSLESVYYARRDFGAHGLSNLMGTGKYNAINFLPLGRLGTIEMRQPYATLEFAPIMAWLEFLHHVKTTALGYESPTDIWSEYKGTTFAKWQMMWVCDSPPIPDNRQARAESVAISLLPRVYGKTRVRKDWKFDPNQRGME